MIKVSVMYPAGDGHTFDMDYYVRIHRPLCEEVFGAALRKVEIDKGVAGPLPGSAAPYLAIGHLHFDSPEAFLEVMMHSGTRLLEDIPNYTNVSPSIQVSEIIS